MKYLALRLVSCLPAFAQIGSGGAITGTGGGAGTTIIQTNMGTTNAIYWANVLSFMPGGVYTSDQVATTAGIQAALDACTNVSGIKYIYFPPNVYNINAPLVIKATGTSLYGDGPTSQFNRYGHFSSMFIASPQVYGNNTFGGTNNGPWFVEMKRMRIVGGAGATSWDERGIDFRSDVYARNTWTFMRRLNLYQLSIENFGYGLDIDTCVSAEANQCTFSCNIGARFTKVDRLAIYDCDFGDNIGNPANYGTNYCAGLVLDNGRNPNVGGAGLGTTIIGGEYGVMQYSIDINGSQNVYIAGGSYEQSGLADIRIRNLGSGTVTVDGISSMNTVGGTTIPQLDIGAGCAKNVVARNLRAFDASPWNIWIRGANEILDYSGYPLNVSNLAQSISYPATVVPYNTVITGATVSTNGNTRTFTVTGTGGGSGDLYMAFDSTMLKGQAGLAMTLEDISAYNFGRPMWAYPLLIGDSYKTMNIQIPAAWTQGKTTYMAIFTVITTNQVNTANFGTELQNTYGSNYYSTGLTPTTVNNMGHPTYTSNYVTWVTNGPYAYGGTTNGILLIRNHVNFGISSTTKFWVQGVLLRMY
jgi:hypothetical protein